MCGFFPEWASDKAGCHFSPPVEKLHELRCAVRVIADPAGGYTLRNGTAVCFASQALELEGCEMAGSHFRWKALAGLVLATTLLSVGCQNKPKTSDKDIVRIEYAQVHAMVHAKKAEDRAVLVDPRPSNHRRTRTIQDSLHIPIQDMTAGDPRLVAAGRIIVFGSDWQDDLSSAAAKRLIALGYQNVFDYRGGVAEWQKQGGSVVVVEPVQ
jgi:rhodanese-related sulfurtransferase